MATPTPTLAARDVRRQRQRRLFFGLAIGAKPQRHLLLLYHLFGMDVHKDSITIAVLPLAPKTPTHLD